MRILVSLATAVVALAPPAFLRAQCPPAATEGAAAPTAAPTAAPAAARCADGERDPMERAAVETPVELDATVDAAGGVFVISLRRRPGAAASERPALRGIYFQPTLGPDACVGPLATALAETRPGTRAREAELGPGWSSMACRWNAADGAVVVLVDTDAGDLHRTIAPPAARAPTPEQVLDALPAGVVLGWYGREGIPAGFVPCDGTGGTPDLVGRFPLGTDDPTEIGSQTGSATHDHAAVHLRAEPTRQAGGSPDGWHAPDMDRVGSPQATGLEHRHGITGLVDPASHIPPSTRLRFICRR